MIETADRRVPVDVVAGLAVAAGVPLVAVPVVVNLKVGSRRALGWSSTLVNERPLELKVSSDWPRGWLTIVGALVDAVPDDRERPYLRLVDHAVIAAYRGVLVIPSKRAQTSVSWPAGEDTTRTKLRGGSWTTADKTAVGQAAQWLETLPRQGGRPRGRLSGRQWSRRQLLELYAEESDLVAGNGGATKVVMGTRLGCHADSVEARYTGKGLNWPPTDEELAELDDEP